MAQEVVTNVVLVSTNNVSDEDAAELVEDSDFDTLEEYASSLETQVESLLATRMFGDADDIPILSVNTYVEDGDIDYEKGVER